MLIGGAALPKALCLQALRRGIAVRDAGGYVRITDRLKDVIKVAGEWVSSLELEDVIAQHPAVADRGFVSKHALLVRVKLVEAIDKTSVGKVTKVALRQKHL